MRILLKKLLLAVSIIGVAGSLSVLLIPQVRAGIIAFGETHVAHRALSHDVWNGRLGFLAFIGLIISVAFLFCSLFLWQVVQFVKLAFNNETWTRDLEANTTAVSPDRFRVLMGAFAAILPSVVLIVFSGRDWLVDLPGFVDTFVYTGYGYNYPDPDFMPGYYKISRLPWVLIQAAAHRLLPHTLVTPVLAGVMVLALSLLGFVLTWRLTRHLAAAVLIGNALALLPLFSSVGFNGGWAYHAVPGILLLGTGLCFLPLRSIELSWKRYIISFSFIALALHTNPLAVLVLPGVIIMGISPVLRKNDFADIRGSIKTLWFPFLLRIILYFVLSCFGITILLCILHKLFYKEWLFFLPNLLMTNDLLQLAHDSTDPWFREMSLFRLDFSSDYYVTFMLFNVVISVILIFARRRVELFGFLSRTTSVAYLINFFGILFTHYIMKSSVFNLNWLAFPVTFFAILPFSFFVVHILHAWKNVSIHKIFFISLAGGGSIILPLLINVNIPYPFQTYPIILLLVFLFFSFLFLYLFKKATIIMLFIVCAMFFSMTNRTRGDRYTKNDKSFIYAAILDHYEALLDLRKRETIGFDEITVTCLGDAEMNLIASSFSGMGLVTLDEKDFGQRSLEHILDKDCPPLREGYVIVLSRLREDEDRAKDILQAAGWIPSLRLLHELDENNAHSYMYVFEIEKKNPQDVDLILKSSRLDYVFESRSELYRPQWSIINYGFFGPKKIPFREVDEHIKYTAANRRDYLAGPFRPLEDNINVLILRIEYTRPIPYSPIVVQDENLNTLARIKLWRGEGVVWRLIPLPKGVKQYHISIQPGKETSFDLPDKIEVWVGEL